MLNLVDTSDVKKDSCEICNREFNGRSLRDKSSKRRICRQCGYKLETYGTTDKDIIGNIKYPYYNNTCPKCNEKKLLPHISCQEYDENGKKTGRWICQTCHNNDSWHRKKDKYNKNRRSLALVRIGKLDPNSETAKGILGEELNRRLFGVKRLSVEYDRYSKIPLDHSSIPDDVSIIIGNKLTDLSTKIPQAKISFCNDKKWQANISGEKGKKFDVVILWCVSEDGKNIDRGYIIPEKEITDIQTISVYKYDSKGRLYEKGRYENYRITDADILKKTNEIWEIILNEMT